MFVPWTSLEFVKKTFSLCDRENILLRNKKIYKNYNSIYLGFASKKMTSLLVGNIFVNCTCVWVCDDDDDDDDDSKGIIEKNKEQESKKITFSGWMNFSEFFMWKWPFQKRFCANEMGEDKWITVIHSNEQTNESFDSVQCSMIELHWFTTIMMIFKWNF